MRKSGIRRAGTGLLALALLLTASVAQAAQTVTLYVTDAQGTVVAQMTPQGAGQPNQVTYTAAYRPYGTQALGTPQDGPGYTGHVNDADSGLVYMQQRYYDPEIGRFLSVDPKADLIGNVFSFNDYEYVNNNPITGIDPSGESCIKTGDQYECHLDGVYKKMMKHYIKRNNFLISPDPQP